MIKKVFDVEDVPKACKILGINKATEAKKKKETLVISEYKKTTFRYTPVEL